MYKFYYIVNGHPEQQLNRRQYFFITVRWLFREMFHFFQKSDEPSHIKDDISKLSHLISRLALKLEEDSTVSTEMENLACE